MQKAVYFPQLRRHAIKGIHLLRLLSPPPFTPLSLFLVPAGLSSAKLPAGSFRRSIISVQPAGIVTNYEMFRGAVTKGARTMSSWREGIFPDENGREQFAARNGSVLIFPLECEIRSCAMSLCPPCRKSHERLFERRFVIESRSRAFVWNYELDRFTSRICKSVRYF